MKRNLFLASLTFIMLLSLNSLSLAQSQEIVKDNSSHVRIEKNVNQEANQNKIGETSTKPSPLGKTEQQENVKHSESNVNVSYLNTLANENVKETLDDSSIYYPGELHLKFKDFTPIYWSSDFKLNVRDIRELSNLADTYGIYEVENSFYFSKFENEKRILRVKFSKVEDVEKLLIDLKKFPSIEIVERIPINYKDDSPNDPLLSNQWGVQHVNTHNAHDITTGSNSVDIAIVDDAIEVLHPDLVNNIQGGWDVADNDNDPSPPNSNFDHGTHVAGSAAASTNNGIGVVSVGRNCDIIPIKASNSYTTITHAYSGISYAANNGAEIISMSFGSYTYSSINALVIANAWNSGAILVASAGNGNNSNAHYPSDYNNVISVANSTSSNSKSSSSNYGTGVDVAAPGVSIYSTEVGGTYGNKSGTSMSAPMVSGLLALIKSADLTASRTSIINCLTSTCTPVSWAAGAGVINALAAVQCAAGTTGGTHDFYISNLVTDAATYNMGDPISIDLDQYTTTPNGSSVSPDLEYTIRNSSGTVLSILGTDYSTLGGGDDVDGESLNTNLPTTGLPSNCQVCAEANYNGNVAENNSIANLSCVNITINTTGGTHDFYISNLVTDAATYNMGDPISIDLDQYTTTPNGSSVSPDLEYTIRNSSGTVLSILGTDYSTLGGGDDEDGESLNTNLPTTGLPSNCQVCAEANYNGNVAENNSIANLSCVNITINTTGGTHDFYISNLVTDAATYNMGDPISIDLDQYTTTPNGSSVSPDLEYTIRNSSGTVLSILGTDYSTLGGGDDEDGESLNTNLPTTGLPSNCQICAEANYNGNVAENNSIANLSCVNITISTTGGTHDFYISNLVTDAATYNMGDPISIDLDQYTTTPNGSSVSPDLEYTIRNSSGTVLSILGTDYSTLGGGDDEDGESLNTNLPTTGLPSNCQICAEANYNGNVAENNSIANLSCVNITISTTGGTHDFYISNLVTDAATYNMGDPISIDLDQYTTTPNGSSVSPDLEYTIRNSSGTVLSILGTDYSTLGGGDDVDGESLNTNLPTTGLPSNCQVCAEANYNGNVAENNSIANLSCVNITISTTGGTHDFYISNLVTDAATYNMGDPISIDLDQYTTTPNGSSVSPDLEYTIRNSSGTVLSILGTDYSTLGGGDDEDGESLNTNLPTTGLPSNCQICAEANYNGNVAENNSIANLSCVNITISTTGGTHDFYISNLVTDAATYNMGDPISIDLDQYTTTPNGSSVSPDLEYTIRNSSGTVLSILGTDYSTLGGGDDVDGESLNTNLPTTGLPSNCQVCAEANYNGNVAENNSIANLSCVNITIGITCNYIVTPLNHTFSSSGGNGTVSISAPAGCSYSATVSCGFVNITSGSTGSGNGTLTFMLDPNPNTTARTCTIMVGGETITISQVGITCNYIVTPSNHTFSSSGGNGTVSISSPAGCSYNATVSCGFVNITSGGSGSGNGTLTFMLDPNPNTTARTCTIMVGGETITISQVGITCNYIVTPSNHTFSSSGGNGTVSISSPAGCSYNATVSCGFVNITSGSTGSGNGTLTFMLDPNPNTTARTCTIMVGGETITISQVGITCNYIVTPLNHTFSSSGGNGTVSISSPAGCSYSATVSCGFVNITSGSTGSGNGTLTFMLDPNPNTTARTCTIMVGGETITISQVGITCNYIVTPLNHTFSSSGGNGTVSISSPAGCSYSATVSCGFVNITSGSTGSGNGTLTFMLDPNPNTTARTCTIMVGGETITISQVGITCNYIVTPSNHTFSSSGGNGTVSISSPAGCSYNATVSCGFVNITSGGSGSGNGTLTFMLDPNPNTTARTCTIMVGGETITISQVGITCNYIVTPSNHTFSSSGGNGTVSISSPAGCSYNATVSCGFVNITSGGSGSGNGTLTFMLDPNPNTTARTCTIMVGGETITISQVGITCNYTVTPSNHTFSSSGGNGTVSISSPAGCSYSATVSCGFVNITSGSTGSGNGTLTFMLDPNPNTTARTCTIMVGGELIIINQDAACQSPIALMNPISNVYDTASSYTLSEGVPAGGSYFGSSVISNVFYSQIAGVGLHEIYYVISNDCNETDTAIGTIEVLAVATGINEINNSDIDINIYPNPTSDVLNISSESLDDVDITIINILGKEIDFFNIELTNGSKTINISSLAKGQYYLHFSKGTSFIKTKKFIVQ